MRVGYAIVSDVALARAMNCAKTPFNVNAIAQIAALAALHDGAWLAQSTRQIVLERERIKRELTNLGFRVAPSSANFLFIDCKKGSEEVALQALMAGIIIKPWKEDGYRNFIRVSVGKRDENDKFIQFMQAS